MNDGLDLGIINSGALVKKGYSVLIANLGKAVALITLLVTALVSFTEVSFLDFGSTDFTSTLIMMLIASYVMYFSLEDAGQKLGRENEAYKESASKYEEQRARVSGDDIADLRHFCIDYINAEYEYRKSNLLFSLGYTPKEYEECLGSKANDRKTRKMLTRIRKMKRAELDAASLLDAKGRMKSELESPEHYRLIRSLLKLLPSTVCMIFTVSVMISLKENLTVAGVIEVLLKLCTLPVIGLRGYAAGYEYAIENERSWIDIKSRLLTSFLNSRE